MLRAFLLDLTLSSRRIHTQVDSVKEVSPSEEFVYHAVVDRIAVPNVASVNNQPPERTA
jgi:hypothetical protein